MRIRLDRTICDGFGACARHAPAISRWMTGYASLIGDGAVPEQDRDDVHAGAAGLPGARHRGAQRATARVVPPQPATDRTTGRISETEVIEARVGVRP